MVVTIILLTEQKVHFYLRVQASLCEKVPFCYLPPCFLIEPSLEQKGLHNR